MKLAVLLNIIAVLALLYVGAFGFALCVGVISGALFIKDEGSHV